MPSAMASCTWRERGRIMYGSCIASKRRAKLVIRLQFVTLKRLEACVLGRRVHVGEQSIGVAEASEFLSCHHSRAHLFDELDHLQPALGQTAADGVETRARVYRAQRMTAAPGPRHDDAGGAGLLSPPRERKQVRRQ